jgi:hypothetical protein
VSGQAARTASSHDPTQFVPGGRFKEGKTGSLADTEILDKPDHALLNTTHHRDPLDVVSRPFVRIAKPGATRYSVSAP